jgi:aminoglycoside phosphotransferase (APT) family kinase protein
MVPARVDRLVDAALGCSVRSAERPEGGRIAETYLLELDGEPRRAVCKIGGPSVRTGGLGRTDGRLRICDPDGLNVPERGRRLARHHPARAGVDWQPVLSHGDLFPGNLLVDGGTITGVLDWGNAHVTTAGYALARAEMRFVDWFRFQGPERRRLRTALREGYREHRSLPPAYPELAGFYKTLWLGQSVDRVVRNLSSRRGRRQMKRHVRGLLPWSDG